MSTLRESAEEVVSWGEMEGEDVSQRSDVHMVDEEVSKDLPECLVEKIVAMMPFPSICKARGLSRLWLVRFASISSLDDEENKSLAASFQKKVCEWSKNWENFNPVLFSEDVSFAYQGASHAWRSMPSLSFLPNNLLSRSNLQMEGPLVCLSTPQSILRVYEVYIVNLLTRGWKQLPPHPLSTRGIVVSCCKYVSETSSVDNYKVILFCEEHSFDEVPGMICSAQIYDSKSDSWSREKFISDDFRVGGSSYLDGVLYMVRKEAQSLLAFNLEKTALDYLSLSFDEGLEIDSPERVLLVVCNVDLLMVVCKTGDTATRLQLLKIDLGSLRLLRLAEGPPVALNVGKISAQPISDGERIFFGLTECFQRVLAYNVNTDEWSCFPVPVPATCSEHSTYNWIGSSIRPLLGPYANDISLVKSYMDSIFAAQADAE